MHVRTAAEEQTISVMATHRGADLKSIEMCGYPFLCVCLSTAFQFCFGWVKQNDECANAEVPNAEMQKCRNAKCTNAKCTNTETQHKCQMHKCQNHKCQMPNTPEFEIHKCSMPNAELECQMTHARCQMLK